MLLRNKFIIFWKKEGQKRKAAKFYTKGDAEDVFISNLECEITRVFSIKNVNSLEVIENSTKRDLSFTCVGGFISSWKEDFKETSNEWGNNYILSLQRIN